MAKEQNPYWSQKRWYAGTANFPKEDIQNAFYFSQAIDYRSDAMSLTLLPASLKESSSVVTDFIKWFDTTPENLDIYGYGDTGNVYKRTTTGAWSNLYTFPNSHGNGLQYFYGDDYLYATSDSTIGRYGPIKYTPMVIEDWREGTIDQTKWNLNFSQGQQSIQTGQVTIMNPANTTSGPFMRTYQFYNIQTQRMIIQAVSVGNQSLASYQYNYVLAPDASGNNALIISIQGNTITAYKQIAGTLTSIGTTSYSATTTKYLAIGEQNGTIYFETSPDGIAFSTFATLTNPFHTTSFIIALQVYTSSNESSATSGIFGAITSQTRLGVAQFTNDFLKAVGGVPQNTASLLLASASSQYAHAASSSSLQITSDITLETEFKANTLPAVGSSMTLLGKWDESGATRSYKLDLFGVSGFFGNGTDGSLTISVNTTDSPIDSAASGAAGTQQVFATNASFAPGQVILLIQMQGANAGQWERLTIQSYSAGLITTTTPLKGTYTSVSGSTAQVLVLKQYTNVTVNSGVTWTTKAWNGTTGGILAFLANGTFTNNGTITLSGKGFRGGAAVTRSTRGATAGLQGEGTGGPSGATSTAANGNAGGGGGVSTTGSTAGGGAGNALPGNSGGNASNAVPGSGGNAVGSSDLSSMNPGGGGGSGGVQVNNSPATGTSGVGGIGGGIGFFNAVTIANNGAINNDGTNGSAGSQENSSGGGAGAGGSNLFKAQSFTNTGSITANNGVGGVSSGSSTSTGGNGSLGRGTLNYLTTATLGTTTPSLTTIQDNTLVTTTTIQARLGISNDGTAQEYLTQNLPSLTTGAWNRLSVSWVAALSQATFYLNGNEIGQTTGTKTAISSNASLLYVGANKGASAVQNFFDGELNDMRIIANAQSASQIFANNQTQLSATYAGLKAYYTFNSVYTDATANANTLTSSGSPVFVSDVPYPNPTTRLDIDQQQAATGNTYALKAAISEATADQLSFTPAFDPQKSVDFNISAKGTGDWTVTVHDQQNNLIAQITVPIASLPASGIYEFIYNNPWRIVINKTYHMHVTQSTADGTLVSSGSNNIATAAFHTYYAFLVTDTDFHPMVRFLNYVVIGNERYIALWDGASYNANFLAFPQGSHVRCFGFWREFLVIGVWQENLNGAASVNDYPTGTIYFWDGIQLTFNFLETIAEGQPNALLGIDTNLYIWAGGNGYLTLYQGGYIYASGNSPTSKVKKMPFLERNASMEINPQAMAFYRSMIHIGASVNSNSTALPRGVWSWGTLNNIYPESLSYDYPISTGNIGNTVSIGSIYGAPDQTLLISWRDGNAYGVDQVNMDNPAASSGSIQTMIIDGERIYHQEQPMKVRVDHLALNPGEGVSVGYQIDRSGSFTYTASNTDSQTSKFTENSIQTGRGREYQFSVVMTSTSGTSPKVLGVSALVDQLATEQQF